MSVDDKDARRTKMIADAAIKGAPLGVVVQRLITLILALCEMLEKRGVDPDNLLEGMTFDETTIDEQGTKKAVEDGLDTLVYNKHERFGTA